MLLFHNYLEYRCVHVCVCIWRRIQLHVSSEYGTVKIVPQSQDMICIKTRYKIAIFL